MWVLALDVGTSSVKAAILDVEAAAPLAPPVRQEYALDHPTPDAAEIPPERLWRAVTAAARAAVSAAPSGEAIAGVGLACLTPALVLLDRKDRPLAPIWTHLDRRSRAVARRVWDECGDEFLQFTGNRPLPGGMTVTSYCRLVQLQPDLPSAMRHFLHVNGWLGLRLTGERAFDPGNASFTGLYGTVADQQWSPRWCKYFGVDPDWLPPVVSGDTTLGGLRDAAAAEIAVRPGVPVKLGVADTSAAILLVDMTEDDLMHVVGTTQVVATLVKNPRPRADLLTRRLGVGDWFVQVAHNPVGGVALDWLRNLCFREVSEEEFYHRLVPHAMERPTTVVLDPPYLGGDRLQIEECNAGFRELTLSSDRMDLLAALLRGMREQHRLAVERLTQGRPIRRIFLTGGGADVVQKLIPEYARTDVRKFEEGSLRGIARLFAELPRRARSTAE